MIRYYPVCRRPDRDGWWTRCYDEERKVAIWRKLKTAATKRQAEIELQQLIRESRRRLRSFRLGAALDDWEALRSSRMTEVSKVKFRAILTRWRAAFGEASLVSTIGIRDVERYHAGLRGRGLGSSTANYERSLLLAFFAWAQEHRFIESNPARSLRREDASPLTSRRVLDPQEMDRLLEACRKPRTVACQGTRNRGGRTGKRTTQHPSEWTQTYSALDWLYPAVLLGARTMLREGTIRQIRWEDVDLVGKVVRVPGAVMKSRRPHEVPLADDVVAVLKQLDRQNQERTEPSPLILPTLPGARWVARAVAKAAKDAGIHGHVTFHCLRKSAATQLLRSGVPLEVVMAIGNWRSAKVLIEHYRGIDPGELRAAVDRLARPAPETPTKADENREGRA